jgi:hypothetical protein
MQKERNDQFQKKREISENRIFVFLLYSSRGQKIKDRGVLELKGIISYAILKIIQSGLHSNGSATGRGK